jgi:hypothetical protein
MKSFTKVRAGSYVTDIEDLHIEIDRIEDPTGYLDWYVFISRVLDGDPKLGARDVGIYTTYAHTYRHARELAIAYADADIILKRVFA